MPLARVELRRLSVKRLDDECERQWEQTYLRTPHGKPVELATGMHLEQRAPFLAPRR